MDEIVHSFKNGSFLFQHLAFKVSGNLGVSNLNQATLRQVICYIVQFEFSNYFCVVSCLKIHGRIHSQLQGIPGNVTFIQRGFMPRDKNQGL